MSNVTKFQKFETRIINRSQIKFASYNPRKISKKAQESLRKNLKAVGLLGGIVWNKRTGNLVAGHQRIAQLDALEKRLDYDIEVQVVDLDEKTEKEQNIFMNSTTVQGEFDNEQLKNLITADHLDFEKAGLDMYDINMLGIADLYQTTTPEQHGAALAVDDLKSEANGELEEGEEDEDDDFEEEKSYEEKTADTKKLKREINDKLNEKLNPDTYITISFDLHKDKAAFMERFGFEVTEKYIKGEVFAEMVERVK
jgi:hypothetical protein